MAYTDANFNVRVQVGGVGSQASPSAAGTATASATQTLTAFPATPFRKFIRATIVSAVRCYVGTAAGGGVTGGTINLLNGTATFATIAVGTSTGSTAATNPGAFVDGTMTTANATFTAGGQPTAQWVGTHTASGSTLGSFAIEFEVSEQNS